MRHCAPHLLPVLLCLLISCAGCAFPRVVVLRDPLTSEERLNLGVTYEKQGEYENALKEYKLAAKDLPVAYLYMGNVYFQSGELDKAEKLYKRSIEKDRANADAYNNLAWLYYVRGENLDKAEAFALKAMQLNPSKIHIYQDTLEKIREKK
jgi:tetratricopeptide (TPR) repeat protein